MKDKKFLKKNFQKILNLFRLNNFCYQCYLNAATLEKINLSQQYFKKICK